MKRWHWLLVKSDGRLGENAVQRRGFGANKRKSIASSGHGNSKLSGTAGTNYSRKRPAWRKASEVRDFVSA